MLLRAERAQHEREDPKVDHDAASLTEVVLETGILIVAVVGLAACTYDAWRM